MDDAFSQPDENGEKYMFQVTVVTGEYCRGEKKMVAAPWKKDESGQLQQYDSVVDNVNNPAMYVVFDDYAAYPEYLIKFRHTR